jgi:hypothetical protein
MKESENFLNLKQEYDGSLSADRNGQTLFSSCLPELIWWEDGAENWTRSAPCGVEPAKTAADFRLTAAFGPVSAQILIRREKDGWQFEGSLRNLSKVPVQLARFSYLRGKLCGRPDFYAMSRLTMGSVQCRAADSVESGAEFLGEKTWGSWGVAWKRLNDPVYAEKDWMSATDVGCCLFGDFVLTLGFTGPGTAFGEVGYGMGRPEPLLYASVLLDNILLEPGDCRVLEHMTLTADKDLRAGLKRWALRCADELGSRPRSHALTGYCSWYQEYSGVKPETFAQAIRDFSGLPAAEGGKTVQLDDGFQRMPGDWRPNSRFASCWDSLPREIAEAGAIPGMWLAPHAIYSGHDMVQRGGGCVQRMADGSPAVTFSNWGWCAEEADSSHKGDGKTWFLDPDHPEAKEMMTNIIRKAVADGWRYLKIDFTYAVSTARAAFDRKKTSFETLRDMYRLFREAAGENVLISSCTGGNTRYSLGYVDISRTGGRYHAELCYHAGQSQRQRSAYGDERYLVVRRPGRLLYAPGKYGTDPGGKLASDGNHRADGRGVSHLGSSFPVGPRSAQPRDVFSQKRR